MRMSVLVALLLAGPVTLSAQARDDTGRPTAAAHPALPAPGEAAALRAAFEAALWPGDIVRAADAYLQLQPADSAVAAQRHAAAQVMQLLRAKDVLVFRGSFTEAPPSLQRTLRQAALGDRAAVVRLAEASRAHDAEHGTRRYVGWMQLAALLRDPEASYQLALHYRRSGQPALAARYETLASDLGHIPLPSLDNSRK